MSARWRIWRGHVVAAGVWLPAGWGDPPTVRALRAWRPGSEVVQLGDGLVLRWPEPRRVDVHTVEGFVLVGQAGLSAVEGPRPADGDLVLPHARIPLADLVPVDLAEQIDLSSTPLAEVVPLGPPPAPVAAPASMDLRERLGLGPAPPSQESLARALRSSFLGRVIRFLRSFFGPQAEGTGPPTPPAWERWLWKVAGPLLARLISGSYQAWLERLLGALDADDVDTVLRNAIPLGGQGGASGPPPLRAPRPRAELAISRHPQAASQSVDLGGGLYDRLHAEYERVLRKLMQAERWDEAAFLLVEILHQAERAVDLLERAGRFALAAEIAETRNLPPARIVRLYLYAERPDDAVRVARSHDAYAAAIALLGKDPRTALLRHAWASSLDRAGDTHGAIAALLPDPALHPHARLYALRAIRAEAPGHEELLGWLLDAEARNLPEVVRRLEPLLLARGPDAADARWRLAHGLLAREAPGLPALRARLARRTAVDLARGDGRDPETTRRLARTADDAALDTDLCIAGDPTVGDSFRVRLAAAAGLPILDALPLVDRSVLVATGETGILHLAPGGRVRARLAEPCHHLIATDGVILGVTERLDHRQVFRIDLAKRRAEPWRELGIGGHAPETLAGIWFAVDGLAVVALDVAGDGARAVWKSPAFKEPPLLRVLEDHIVITGDGEDWTIARAGFRLVARDTTTDAPLHLLLQPEPPVAWTLCRRVPGLPEQKTTLTPADTTTTLHPLIPRDGVQVAVGPREAWAWSGNLLRGAVLGEQPQLRTRGGALVAWSGSQLVVVDLATRRIRTDTVLHP